MHSCEWTGVDNLLGVSKDTQVSNVACAACPAAVQVVTHHLSRKKGACL